MGSSLRIDRCVCLQTPFARLLPLARTHGWTVTDIGVATGCGTRCGLCRPYLREMLMTGTTVFDTILTDPSPDGQGI
jgi:bacterioferritin-associated ferredoxin